MIYDNECLEKLNLINWVVEIGCALVPAIALFLGLLFLKRKLKGTKYDLSRLIKSRDSGISLFKLRLMVAICVILVVPPVLYARNKLVEPVLLEMHEQCWAIIYPQIYPQK